MDLLKQRILRDASCVGDDIIRVDSFLNHQIDPLLLKEIGEEFKRIFGGLGITKVLTVEASGIAIAAFTAYEFGVPFVFAKKSQSRNLSGDAYEAEAFSFTKNHSCILRVSKEYIKKDDVVLIVDDFLANGKALLALIDIVRQAGATIAGCGIAIEKGFQPGGGIIRGMGINLHSLAVIKSIKQGKICFI